MINTQNYGDIFILLSIYSHKMYDLLTHNTLNVTILTEREYNCGMTNVN